MATESIPHKTVVTNGGPEAAITPDEQARIEHRTAALASPPPNPHGTRIRGLSLTGGSPATGGRFGRLFAALGPADFGATDAQSEAALKRLGRAMVSSEDPPKDGPDNEESGFPAAYTYLGQFIDHDLTFDPVSSLARQDDPDALVDFRTPRFDLDDVYGRGPDDQPYLYSGGRTFLLGRPLTGGGLGTVLSARDLPRSNGSGGDPSSHRAIIGEPRNDENVIVSQFQGLMLRFHNVVATRNPGMAFAEVQRLVRFHYQWVVLNDFLPTVVSKSVLAQVLPHVVTGTNVIVDPPTVDFFDPGNPIMPLEFSAAAYRFGHSMIRPAYRLNDEIAPLPIFAFPSAPNAPALGGFTEFPSQWAIDWGRFIDLEARPYGNPAEAGAAGSSGNLQRTQLAYKIDTSLVDPLKDLPLRVASDPPPSLPARNLLRGWRLRLPSGQAVARAMGLAPMADADIKIGKFTGDPADIKGSILDPTLGGPAFAGNCPLWTYVLAETQAVDIPFATTDGTQTISSRRLGPVGGRIVAETFAGLMLADPSSFLNVDPLFMPDTTLANAGGTFGLRELIAAAVSEPV
ncbi:MAG TPA: heme peroxidase family protein [Solirubrobacteraceae bacterium]